MIRSSMTYQELKIQSKEFKPLLLLEDYLPHHIRKRFLKVLSVFLGLFFLLIVVQGLMKYGLIENSLVFSSFQFKVRGIFLLLLALWIATHLLDSFFYSYYFRINKNRSARLSFELATILYHTPDNDITFGFLRSHYSYLILLRLGLDDPVELRKFLDKRKAVLTSSLLSIDKAGPPITTLSDYALLIFDHDKDLSEFLFGKKISRQDLLGASNWVMSLAAERMRNERWWSKENLGRIPGIGKSWAYGQIGLLKRYGQDLSEAFSDPSRVHYNGEEVSKLETVLSRSREANALLVNDNEAGSLSIVSLLALEIKRGTALPLLEQKRIFLLDTNALISENKEKTALEGEMEKLLNEAVHAGNIILAFENFPGFLGSAKAIGSDIRTLLVPYLLSTSVQVIAMSDTEAFHQILEPDRQLISHFETMLITEKGDAALIEVIEKRATELERRNGVLFTYQAITEIAKDAARYFNDTILSDKAIDLLLELVPRALRSGKYLIRSEDVLALVESKTGIPTGAVKGDEKEKLIHLEEILHKRIVGQDEAIVAVSQAMRRSRSGIEATHRPMGSFLFLGPTGVGKTETTKALNEVFFGNNSEILRLDMSEYSSFDALNKLIGSFEGGKQGVLSTLLREHPYGVLLLDEFEKTTPEVKNLFLQVLDEGSFKDMTGRNITAENLIIIATSNAGSDLIWELFKSGTGIKEGRDKIIDEIVEKGIFKPELLNRFDKVILFHPLNEDHLQNVARLMLEGYSKRLLERGIRLLITPDLIKFLVSVGMDPKFGARPMNRAINDKVEALIAEEMIKGNISTGMTIKIVRDPNNAGSLQILKKN